MKHSAKTRKECNVIYIHRVYVYVLVAILYFGMNLTNVFRLLSNSKLFSFQAKLVFNNVRASLEIQLFAFIFKTKLRLFVVHSRGS